MNNYEYTDIYNRLYEKEMDLIKKENHDVGYASIILLGKDMKKISNDQTKDEIIKILDNELKENSDNRLALSMKTRRNTQGPIEGIIKKIKNLLSTPHEPGESHGFRTIYRREDTLNTFELPIKTCIFLL